MSRAHGFAPSLLCALGLLAAAPALTLAKDEEAPLWTLGEDKQRYDLQLTSAREPLAQDLAIQPKLLLSDADFEDARLPRLRLTGPGDLVWHFALRLPDPKDEVQRQKKRRGPLVVEVDERFETPLAKYRAHGNQSLRVKGRRAQIRSSLLIESEGKSAWLTKGNLVVQSVFNLKSGRLESAEFTFEAAGQGTDGNARLDVWKGAIQPAQPVRVVGKDFHLEVETAIREGSAWLERETQKRLAQYKGAAQPEHQRVGKLALPVFALLRSGVPAGKLDECFKWLASQPLEATYSVALWIMALEARSIERQAIPPRDRTRSVTRFQRQDPAAADKELIKRATAWLLRTRKVGEGWWSYYGNPGEGASEGPLGHDHKTVATSGDRSNSQFAVLALHSAMASGVEIPAAVWKEVAQEALKSQDDKGPPQSLGGSVFGRGSPFAKDLRDRLGDPNRTLERAPGAGTVETAEASARGWAYSTGHRPNGGAYGSMSAAGASTLAVAREALRELDALEGPLDATLQGSLRDGLAWLLNNYDVARNPRRAGAWYFYYAYSLEKAMDTAGVERLGGREWWRDLAAELLTRRDPKTNAWGTVEDTAFALLVLNRATLPASLQIGAAERKQTGEVDPSQWDVVVVDGVGQLSVRQLLAAMAESAHEAKERLELARKAIAALPEVDRPRLVPELMGLLPHRHKQTRKWAQEGLIRYAGSDEPQRLEGFVASWERVRLTGESLDYAHLADLRAVIEDPKTSLPLLDHTLLVAGRMRALELVEPLLAQLESADPGRRRVAWTHLVSLVEQAPAFDPAGGASARTEQVAALRSYWRQRGPAQLQAEAIQRDLRSLSYPGREAAARAALLKAGRPAVPALIDALRGVGRAKTLAHGLLIEITKAKLPPEVEPWQEWLEKAEQKAGPSK